MECPFNLCGSDGGLLKNMYYADDIGNMTMNWNWGSCSAILTFIFSFRYYYDGDMISKVQGKRFVYKFVCDLRTLIGYSAAELNNLVTECEQKKLARIQMHGIGQPITTVTLATTTLDKDSWRGQRPPAATTKLFSPPLIGNQINSLLFLTQLCSFGTELQGWSLISVD